MDAYNSSSVNGKINFRRRYIQTTKQDRTIETGAHGRHEHAYLVAVESDEQDSLWSVEDSLSELKALASTAGADVVGTMIQRLHHPDVATYIGKGRAQELGDLEKQLGFDLVIFDDELSPSQQRNLEKMLNARVIDRTALILDILRSMPGLVKGGCRLNWPN